MLENKVINRKHQNANQIFNQRNLVNDYRTLIPVLKSGMRVLDIGCGTGSISRDIANRVGKNGFVVGIDNTNSFIESGKKLFEATENLSLVHSDLFEFESEEKFDLIVSARTFQWLSTVEEALQKIKSLLKPQGIVSVLDYNHTAIQWNPEIPPSMKSFYATFLKWREDANMNNAIVETLPNLLSVYGFKNIQVFESDEFYDKSSDETLDKLKIWSKVASSTQMVDEGYLDNDLRIRAIEDYTNWVDQEAISMTMKLKEIRASLN